MKQETLYAFDKNDYLVEINKNKEEVKEDGKENNKE